MRAWLERYANRVWYETEAPPWPWRALSFLHGKLIDKRWHRPSGQPSIPVIVVGNLAVGGCGKTPAVIALAGELVAEGRSVAVISRGYGAARAGNRRPLRVSPGDDPGVAGDEPVLIARSTGVPVWVCRNRDAAFRAALADDADVVIADDGLQHRRLARSFEIALIDARRGFGNGHLLPAGPLRQPMARLDEVDAVIYRTSGLMSDDAGIDPSQCFHLRPQCLRRLADDEMLPVDACAGQSVSAVCGIANPGQFVRTLESLGQRVTLHAFADHHRFTAADLDSIAPPIVTTAKDAVKLALLQDLGHEIFVLDVAAVLPDALRKAVMEHVQQFAR